MEKIKVLLVDDEKLERILIRKGFPWEERGFTIIGEADSASEAMEWMEKEKPELVVTDISMPNITGLELSERIKQDYPDCYIIIVTGYRDFEYARQAVKIGVEDFILKPVNIEEIGKVADKIKKKIEAKKKNGACLTRKKGYSRVVEQTLEYIDRNYCDPEITLGLVAEKVFSNESYLSRVFKKEVGNSLIEYVTARRIEESIRLLNTTDLKVYEVAEKVGFRDPHYFSICFKKQIGMTVKQFKNQAEEM